LKYVGLEIQQERNNRRSVFLLCCFPLLVLALTFIACYVWGVGAVPSAMGEDGSVVPQESPLVLAMDCFTQAAPWVTGGVALWFFIAFFANTAIINAATGAKPLERKDNKRVYNLVENLCIAGGISMPRVQIVEDPGLNAFASGIGESSYTVTLTRGIINALDDEELEGVIAHELTHIRNHDVRVLIISIVFVGIFAMLAELSARLAWFCARSSGRSRGKGNAVALGIALGLLFIALLAFIGYCASILMRFAISRNREYMADAGGASLTKKPWALARALRKISGNSEVSSVHEASVQQLFIEHGDGSGFFNRLFATHPPIGDRIAVLENI
jgi:heat shock protein HtpX